MSLTHISNFSCLGFIQKTGRHTSLQVKFLLRWRGANAKPRESYHVPIIWSFLVARIVNVGRLLLSLTIDSPVVNDSGSRI